MRREHGSNSTYTNHGCRCDPCRTASREWAREHRRKTTTPSPDEHEPPAQFRPDAGYAAPRIRPGKTAEFIRWERTRDGLTAHTLRAEVRENTTDGWIIHIRNDEWAATEP